jgi:hypothetical protein
MSLGKSKRKRKNGRPPTSIRDLFFFLLQISLMWKKSKVILDESLGGHKNIQFLFIVL